MRCVICDRPLTVAALTLPTKAGPLNFGPKCAKRAMPDQAKGRRETARPAKIQPDGATVDWLEAQEGTKSGAGAVFSAGVVHG